MLIHDKHEGWLTTCDYCEAGCFHCDYNAVGWEADITDFDGETVRLNDGTVGIVVCFGENAWLIDADDNEYDAPDVADIAAVLEAVS